MNVLVEEGYIKGGAMLRWSYFSEASTCVLTVADSFIESHGCIHIIHKMCKLALNCCCGRENNLTFKIFHLIFLLFC